MRTRRAACAVAVAFIAFVGPTLPVGASGLAASGWWWRVQTGVLAPVPSPPNVPAGGFMVGGTPDGPSALAAMRFDLDPGELPGVLTLQIASDDSAAVVVACASAGPWIPAQAGRWDARPTPACDRGMAPGTRSPDGKSLTFDLAAIPASDAVDVVIAPGKVAGRPAGADTASFQMTFNAPTDASLAPAAPPPSFESTETFESEEPFTAEDFSSTFEPEAFFTSPDLTLPEFGETIVSNPAVDAVATPPQVATTAGSLRDAVDDGFGKARGVAALVALAAIAAGLYAYRQPTPAFDGLGRFTRTTGATPTTGQPEPGGLGRFVRPRQGPAPRL